MYKPVGTTGDSVAVPQLLFSRLTSVGADDGRFRVALYVLEKGGADAATLARELRLPAAKVEAALNYWEGAGLIETEAPAGAKPLPAPRKKLTTREAVKAGEADPVLGMLLGELQRVFGAVIGEKDTNAYVSLYVVDGFAADLILVAASEAAARGISRAAYVDKVLMDWRRQGINDCAAADAHLRLLAKREAREQALARAMGLEGDPFTLAEKRKIAVWHEEYGYDEDMIEAARMAAGDKHSEVKYLAGILKNWNAKGYQSPRDVQQGDTGRNLRVTGTARIAPENDILSAPAEYVPLAKGGRA